MWHRRPVTSVTQGRAPTRSRRSGHDLDGHTKLLLAARIGLLVLAVSLEALTTQGDRHVLQLVALVVVAAAFTVPETLRDRWVPELAVSEAVAVAVVVASVAPLQAALLPYLLAPALAAGLMGGVTFAVMSAGLPALVLIGSRLLVPNPESVTSYMGSASLWVSLALATALLGAWIRRIELSAAEGNRTYDEVNRLLLQLRDAARHLPGSLDEVTIAQSLLQDLRSGTRFSRGGVSAVSEGGRLVPLARLGASASELSVELDEASVWGRASTRWRPPSPRPRCPVRRRPSVVVLPIAVDDRLVALVGLERSEAPFGPEEIARCAATATATAPGLDTASLFAEVRTIATAEERRRLAREIHDGIAQELASLGYAVERPGVAATRRGGRDGRPARAASRADPCRHRAAPVDLRPPQRGAPRHRRRRGAVRLRPLRRRGLGPHRAPRAGRAARPAAGRGRGRAAAHRAGGDHERAQARRGRATCG